MGPARACDEAFIKQLQGYGLTTAHILYCLPDHPSLLQSYIWQEYDVAPKFPVLNAFLRLAHVPRRAALTDYGPRGARKLIKPAELRLASGEFVLN